jgi:hypothetical protein
MLTSAGVGEGKPTEVSTSSTSSLAHRARARSARGYCLGDYQGLTNDGTAFKSVFVQTNSGNTSNRTDAFATTITP